MSKKLARDDSGWRSLGEVAREIGISRSVVYPRSASETNSPLKELIQRGLVERRFFRGERGRGGEVMRLRIAFENELIKEYVERKIRIGSSRITNARVMVETKENSSLVKEINLLLDKNRIAVLPLVNISRDANDEYFADGMTEELISTLSRIGELKVIARTSVMTYKGKDKRIDEIARQLNVGTILEGSVRKEGRKLRISVQLSDASNGDNLWSETYDKEFTDVFAIQSDISNQVASALRVQLSRTQRNAKRKIPTLNAEGYELYLKGRHCFQNLFSMPEAEFRRSIQYFQRAIDLDPYYAQAYAWLSASYAILAYNCWARVDQVLPMAEVAVNKALELEPNLVEAQNALFLINYCKIDWSGCETAARKIRESGENLTEFYEIYHYYLLTIGKLEESLAEANKALELDPLSTWANLGPALVMYYQRNYDRAIEYFRNLLEFDPDSVDGIQFLGRCFLMKSMYQEGLSYFQEGLDRIARRRKPSPSDDQLLADVACAYAWLGRTDEARAILRHFEEASRDHFVAAWTMIYIHLALGENDDALSMIEKAHNEHLYISSGMTMKVDPFYDNVRSNPRFIAILTKMGL